MGYKFASQLKANIYLQQKVIIKRISSSDARFLFVGDRDQSINGFCGADPRSFDLIIQFNKLKFGI